MTRIAATKDTDAHSKACLEKGDFGPNEAAGEVADRVVLAGIALARFLR